MAQKRGDEPERLRDRSQTILALLRKANGTQRETLEARAIDHAKELKALRQLSELAKFTDLLRSLKVGGPIVRTLQAQALVDQRLVFAALDVLNAGSAEAEKGSHAWRELHGLLGRVYKQLFLDAPDRTSPDALTTLRKSIKEYLTVFEQDPAHGYWHGVNLAALLVKAKSMGQRVRIAAEPEKIAERICQGLDDEQRKDEWWHATYAEAELARGRDNEFSAHLKKFLRHRRTNAFAINSFLRQLVEVWDLDRGGAAGFDGVVLVSMLRAELLKREHGVVDVSSAEIASTSCRPDVSEQTRKSLQKTFGPAAPVELRWWELGIERARSVAAIYGPSATDARQRKRYGTGFLVAVKNAKNRGAPIRCVLTNAHVIGDPDEQAIDSIRNSRVKFEGRGRAEYRVKRVLWTSPVSACDATLLEIVGLPDTIPPIPLSRELPKIAPSVRLYIIGHPQGQELAFSFQDNELLDYGCFPWMKAIAPAVTLVHYRTPTEPGSSGSPVFIQREWQAVALHHSGDRHMRKLNGRAGTYEANEGITLASISDALAKETGLTLVF
jgi:hypothetical protein